MRKAKGIPPIESEREFAEQNFLPKTEFLPWCSEGVRNIVHSDSV